MRHVEGYPPYVPDEVVTLTPAACATDSASIPFRVSVRTPGEKRPARLLTDPFIADGRVVQVTVPLALGALGHRGSD